MNNFNEIKNILKEIKMEIEPTLGMIERMRNTVDPAVNKIKYQMRDIIDRYNLR